jgi:hypothetical protein
MLVAQQTPTAPRPLEEPAGGNLTVHYAPEPDGTVEENPPRFVWLPELDAGARYALRLTGGDLVEPLVFTDIPRSFFTPDRVLTPGRYQWSYALWRDGVLISAWSADRAFTLADGLPETPALRHDDRYGDLDLSHPRLWLNGAALAEFRTAIADDPEHAGWATFVAKSAKPWLDRSLIDEPKPYPNNTRVPALWRRMYIDCQEALYAIRHLAIAGVVGEDAAMIARARDWLLHVAAWDPRGPTGRDYNDEAAFRIAVALAWGYDWLYSHLTEEERDQVRAALKVRLEQVAVHVIDHAKIHVFPYDSHAVRAVGAVLIPAAIAALDDIPEARNWLDFAIDYYDGLYPPWGGVDGGWAEGPHYWTTAMAYFTEAANLLRAWTGHDLYRRPFFRNTGWFPLYAKAPDIRRSCFGDDSTLGDAPSLKVGYNMRQFAGVTGNPAFQWYFERIKAADPGTEMEFYNYGWWDFRFDDLLYRTGFPEVAAAVPADLPRVRHFRDIGWVAIQKDMADSANHLQFLAKCSPYGSMSHSHGDQGAFLLYAYGEDLAVQNGHYIGHGTSIHRNWRRMTRSKNAILIGGKGQYAGNDKMMARRSRGRVLGVSETKDAVVISLDPTEAYRTETPSLKSYRRDIHFVNDSYFVIVDEVELDEALPIDWLMQTLAPCDITGQAFRYEAARAGLTGEFVLSTSGPMALRNTAAFAEYCDPAEIEGLERHATLVATTPAAQAHSIVTLLTPYPKGTSKRVFHFLDDQGFASQIYFQDATDHVYGVTVAKRF